MKDPANREIMARLYRLIEKYEEPPKVKENAELTPYFQSVLRDLESLYNEFRGNLFARELTQAVYFAIGERATNTDRQKYGTPEPTQEEMKI